MRRSVVLVVVVLVVLAVAWPGRGTTTGAVAPGGEPQAARPSASPSPVGAAGHPQEPDPAGIAPVEPAPATVASPVRVRRHQPPDATAAAASQAAAELRRRVAAATAMHDAAQAGDAAAAERLRAAQEAEADPRLRAALAGRPVPGMATSSSSRRSYPDLPQPAARAEAGALDVHWTSGRHDEIYQSQVLVWADGRAVVETRTIGNDGGEYHVRYQTWAWRDAAGNLVLDARGQAVQYLERPPHGGWSPDSMVITPGGVVELIDDKFDDSQGSTGAGVSG